MHRLHYLLLLPLLLWQCGASEESPMHDRDRQAEAPTEDAYTPREYVQLTHPEWSKNATIYQLNTRQFTQAGTFKAAQAELPRLKTFGADIIWMMPVWEIGQKNRKGTLGSPYSIKDYYQINPEFGTEADLKAFVEAAHEQGMYVILDFVANHTAWDNQLVTDHPDWYDRDYKGDFRPTPWWDWSDIIDLDFDQPGVREYLTDVMTHWVRTLDIDGYRCDVAGFVPIEFWENVRAELDAIKPVFMLAEWESRDLHARAFDMTYAWTWNEAVHQICLGKADVYKLYIYYSWNESAFPPNSMRMTFVSNHDKNAWEGTMYEQFGDGLQAAIALSVVGEGMPLVYNGQEAGNARRLAFFEKDPIEWREDEIGALYTKLFGLMKSNSALWHAKWGATMQKVPNSAEGKVLSFVRQNDDHKVFAVFNFSAEPQEVAFGEELYHDRYTDFDTGGEVVLSTESRMSLSPWAFKIYSR